MEILLYDILSDLRIQLLQSLAQTAVVDIVAGAEKSYDKIPAYGISGLKPAQVLAQPAADLISGHGCPGRARHHKDSGIGGIRSLFPALTVQSKIIRLILFCGFEYLRDHFSAFKAMAGQTTFSF
jgi:hypothetical protein